MPPPSPRPKTFLILSQVYIPDPASVGQHMADVATEMVRRGYRVKVFAANRGYDDPSLKYLSHETINGVEIRRLPLSSFGKKRILTRIIGTAIFMAQVFFVALFTPHIDGIFFSTSPPLIGFVASLAAMIRRVPVAYWAMDLNPDQLIAMDKIKETSWTAKFLEKVNRFILRRASLVVVLDRFMADRLTTRAPLDGKMIIMPPWSHENHVLPVNPATNPFRIRHGLVGKFVIMYSGNHSPANPLATLLQAAIHFKDEPDLRFLFIGGGIGKKEVNAVVAEHKLTHTLSLPYQPLGDLRYSLSAADVHVVSLGSDMVGIIHPCKIYGSMAVARPILYFGPSPSHVSDLLDDCNFGWHISHGDVAGAIRMIDRVRKLPPDQLCEMGMMAQRVLELRLNRELLTGRFCDALEKHLQLTDA